MEEGEEEEGGPLTDLVEPKGQVSVGVGERGDQRGDFLLVGRGKKILGPFAVLKREELG